MKVAIDTNVVLDLLMDRRPWSAAGGELFAAIVRGELEGLICATSVTTLHYLAAREVGDEQARRNLRQLMTLCTPAPVTRAVLDAAFDLDLADFEDAVLHEAARFAGAEAIVTRDAKGFRKTTLPTVSPLECLQICRQRARTGES